MKTGFPKPEALGRVGSRLRPSVVCDSNAPSQDCFLGGVGELLFSPSPELSPYLEPYCLTQHGINSPGTDVLKVDTRNLRKNGANGRR